MRKPSRLSDAIDYIIFFLILLGLVTMLNSCAPRPDKARARETLRNHRKTHRTMVASAGIRYLQHGERDPEYLHMMREVDSVASLVKADLVWFNTLKDLK
jgi:hypothetical protein